tara:strand:- start:611 stop:823 length:213 start_codon:yes stop_codon:yes gene_type:complete
MDLSSLASSIVQKARQQKEASQGGDNHPGLEAAFDALAQAIQTDNKSAGIAALRDFFTIHSANLDGGEVE